MIGRAVYMGPADRSLFGVMTEVPAPRGGVLLLPGGGYTFTPQRNRWGVRLAEMLAAKGWSTLRFDWAGIGDSAGEARGFDLAAPFTEDARYALDEIRPLGPWLAVGNCFGARTALALAAERPAGVVLISPPVRDSARGSGTATRMAQDLDAAAFMGAAARKVSLRDLTDPARRRRAFSIGRAFVRARIARLRSRVGAPDPTPWASPLVLDGMRTLTGAGVPILVLYGAEDSDFDDFRMAMDGRLGAIVRSRPGLVEVSVVPGKMHGLTTLDAQEALIGRVDDWIERTHLTGGAAR